MKQILSILGIALLLSSCNDAISKKPNLETAKEDIAKIKEKYKNDYSAEDFEVLGDKLAGKVLGGVLVKGENAIKEGITFDKTYKEYLDEIKKERLEREELAKSAKKAEEERMAKMNNAIAVTMYGKEYFPKNYDRGIYEDYNIFKYAIKNKTNKEIKAIAISFTVYNALGNQIGKGFNMDFTDGRIPANGNYEGEVAYSINQFINDDNVLKNAKFEDLSFKFDITKIVYSDGTILE